MQTCFFTLFRCVSLCVLCVVCQLSSCQQKFHVRTFLCHCKICIHEKDESIANERGERWQKTNEKPSFIESNEVNECLKMDCIMCDAVRVVESCYYYSIRNSSVGCAFVPSSCFAVTPTHIKCKTDEKEWCFFSSSSSARSDTARCEWKTTHRSFDMDICIGKTNVMLSLQRANGAGIARLNGGEAKVPQEMSGPSLSQYEKSTK